VQVQRDVWCICHHFCRYEDAEEACRNAVEIWEEKSGPTASVTSGSLELLAKIMRGTARYGTLGHTLFLHVQEPCFRMLNPATVIRIASFATSR